MFIKPAEGRAARHPGTLRPLAAEGEHVQSSPFWLRLLANGDVVKAVEPEPSVPVETTPTEQTQAVAAEQLPADTSAATTETSTNVDIGEIR